MKRTILSLVSMICMMSAIAAQEFVNEFGKVSKEELEFSFYPQDKSANAVVIYDIGVSSFKRNNDYFELNYDRTTRIKIFKEEGVKWATVEIPFYHEGLITERITQIEACTYNLENGEIKKTELKLNATHDEKLNEFWSVSKFQLPNVKAGSVIEYHYILSSEFKENFRSWNFQWKIPVIYSKYVTKMIPFYQYQWTLQGATKFDSQKTYVDNSKEEQSYVNTHFRDVNNEFVMKNIPAFNDDSFISSANDYMIKMVFRLSKVLYADGTSKDMGTTWQDLDNYLIRNNNFGGYLNKSEKLAPKINQLKWLQGKTETEKFDSIMNYVKNNYIWNRNTDILGTKDPDTFSKEKIGNVAEINLFAAGLLRAFGIKATPVILSTCDHGKINLDYPEMNSFNWVCILAQVDGKSILTDGTDKLNQNNRIPLNCINEKGLLISKDKVEWAVLQSLIPSKKQTIISISLNDKVLNSTIEINATDYFALDYRKKYSDDIASIQKLLENKGNKVVESSILVKNQFKVNEPYMLKFSTSEKPEMKDYKIYISPFMNESLKESPLKQQTRTYAMDMQYPVKQSFLSEITVPEGFKVESVPENEKINNDQFEFNYSTSVNENKIVVNLTFYFKFPIYPAEDYFKIRYYYKEIAEKGEGKIVLVRK